MRQNNSARVLQNSNPDKGTEASSSSNLLSAKDKWLGRLKGYKSIQVGTFAIREEKAGNSKSEIVTTITLLDISLSADSDYSARSDLLPVTPNQRYMVTTECAGIVGKPQIAFFGVSLFNAKDEFIERRIKWLNDFSGEINKYTIVFDTHHATKVRLIYRINTETPVKSYCEYKLLPVEKIEVLIADPNSGVTYDTYSEPSSPSSSLPPVAKNATGRLADVIKKEVELAKSTKQLVFPKPVQPKVSIIVLNYNRGEYTFNCLSSILRNTKAGTYEVILVDNGSNEEESKQILKKLVNAKVLQAPENLGFIKGNNYAAKHAAGEYLLFLNNDTIVLKGWLDALLRTFEIHDKVGAVGSKFIYPNGTLQEAGSMIWKDGSARGYGRNVDDPSKPEYHYVREVDFCSGASLIVRKDLFLDLGMFNEFYAPAYFEDVDLCFGIRSKGYKVMFNPFSSVVHYEGMTSGRDPHNQNSVKRFEIINRPKFVSQWKNELEKRYAPLDANVLYSRDLKKGSPVLIVEGWVPEPDKSSGDLRSYNIIKIFSRLGCKVTLFLHYWKESKYANDLRELGVEVIPFSYITIDRLLKERPKYYKLVLVNLSRVSLANTKHCFDQVRNNGTSTKFALHIDDLFGYAKIVKSLAPGNQYDVSNEDGVMKAIAETSLDLLNASDTIFTISESEKRMMNSIVKSDKALIIPEMRQPIPMAQIPEFKKRENVILFVGGFSHPPNVDSARILVREVFPKVKARVPDSKLFIVGNVPPPEFTDLKDESIVVTGFTEDLSGYYSIAKVAVAPIVAKGGVKGKIIEALNYYTPAVTSPLGIEGTELRDESDILVAKDSAEFAEKIVKLLEDEKLWEKIAYNGRKYFEAHNSTLQTEKVLGELVKQIDETNSIGDKLRHWGSVENVMEGLQIEAPLAVLLLLYSERQDLQNTFPEVEGGEYGNLIQWAARDGTTIDSGRQILLPHRAWFTSKVKST